MTKKNTSLTERVRQITSAALMAGSLFMGSSAQAAVRHTSSVLDRAIAVQDVLKSKIAADGPAVAEELPRAQLLVAQWGNRWGNWRNWDKWHNWKNWDKWNNWHNWFNWMNF